MAMTKSETDVGKEIIKIYSRYISIEPNQVHTGIRGLIGLGSILLYSEKIF